MDQLRDFRDWGFPAPGGSSGGALGELQGPSASSPNFGSSAGARTSLFVQHKFSELRGLFCVCVCCSGFHPPSFLCSQIFFSSPLPFSTSPLWFNLVGRREEAAERSRLWAEGVKSFLAPEQQFSNRSVHLNERNHSLSHLILKFHIFCFHFRTKLLFCFPPFIHPRRFCSRLGGFCTETSESGLGFPFKYEIWGGWKFIFCGRRSCGQQGLCVCSSGNPRAERGFSLPTSGVWVPPTSAAPRGCSELHYPAHRAEPHHEFHIPAPEGAQTTFFFVLFLLLFVHLNALGPWHQSRQFCCYVKENEINQLHGGEVGDLKK